MKSTKWSRVVQVLKQAWHLQVDRSAKQKIDEIETGLEGLHGLTLLCINAIIISVCVFFEVQAQDDYGHSQDQSRDGNTTLLVNTIEHLEEQHKSMNSNTFAVFSTIQAGMDDDFVMLQAAKDAAKGAADKKMQPQDIYAFESARLLCLLCHNSKIYPTSLDLFVASTFCSVV